MKFFFRSKRSAWPLGYRSDTRRVIFLYHRIATPRFDPYALAVPENWFQDHIEILKSFCQLVSLDEIMRTKTASSGLLASITFDDGYTDNLITAWPILRVAEVPATFFICTGSLGDVRGFWWDRLATAIAAADADRDALEFHFRTNVSLSDDLSSPEARQKATLNIAGRLQRTHPVHRDRVLADLENVLLAGGSGNRESFPVLDETGVRELGSHPLAAIGVHTQNHPMLSTLTPEEQLKEIDGCAAKLQVITGTRPRFMAYPYGSMQDYNDDSCWAARDVGLEAAFGNHAGLVDPKSQPYRVPRYYVPPIPAEEFRTWLHRLFHV
jgi:peptidoglycan/xylan/chitin deacetylase (PgdA/CDA1 family)